MPLSPCNQGPVVIDRRAGLAGALAVLLAPGSVLAAGRKAEFVYIGMHGDKVHAARFDPVSGDLTAIGPVAEGLRPTWTTQHPRLPILYVTDEVGNDGKGVGGVLTFRADPATGGLTPLGNVRAGAGGTTNLWFDSPSRTLLTANFAGAVTTLPIRADQTPGEPTSVVKTVGSGPHPRQASPHAHAAVVDPTGRHVLIADMGADRVFVLPFDRRAGRIGALDPAAAGHYAAPAGSGPRHLAIHPNGRLVYLLCELTAEVHILSWNPAQGRLQAVRTVALSGPDFKGVRSGAELTLSADGRFLYVINRNENELVVFAVDRRGDLSLIQRMRSGGERPWHFAIHQSGRWLLVANRDSNGLRLFAIDRRSGRLTDTGKGLVSPTPVHALFLRG